MTVHPGDLDPAAIADIIRTSVARAGERPWLPDPEDVHIQLLADGVYHANFLIRSGESTSVARVVRASQWGLIAIQQLQREHAVLVDLQQSAVAPAPLALIDDGPFPFMVQSYVSGQYADHHADLAPCARAIAVVHRCLPETSGPLLDRRDPKEFLIGDSAERLERCPVTHANSHVLGLLNRAHEVLAGTQLPELRPVLTHTDLIQRNLLVDGDTCRIVDWEGARIGSRAWDLAYFLSPLTLGWADPRVTLSDEEKAEFLDAYSRDADVSVDQIGVEVAALLPFVLVRALSWCVEYAAHAIDAETTPVRDRLGIFTSEDFVASTLRQSGVSL